MATQLTAARSQPIAEDVFGDFAEAPSSPVLPVRVNPNAVDVVYKRGDLVYYRQRDGTDVPAKVVAVDMAVYPPSYGVEIGDIIRETEASRLRSRSPAASSKTAPHSSITYSNAYPSSSLPLPFQQQGFSQREGFSPSSPNGSFDSFQSAWSAQPHLQHHHQQHQHQLSNLSNKADTAAGWHPQGFASDMPVQSDFSLPSNAASSHWSSSAVPHDNGPFSGRGQASDRFHRHAPAADGDGDEEEDGFGDFAEAPPSPHRAAAAAAPEPAFDRSAPLAMSLFGEESYEEEPMTMQLGPVWAPSWLAPPAASPPPSHTSPHTLPDTIQSAPSRRPQQQQQDGISPADMRPAKQQHQQADFAASSFPDWIQSSSTAADQGVSASAPGISLAANSQDAPALSDDAGEASDFGSFTGGSPTLPPVLPLGNASSAAQQTSTPVTTLGMAKASSNSAFDSASFDGALDSAQASEAYQPNGATARPAAAAARNSVLQSVNRSMPISLDAFGEEEAEDPALDMPSQPAAILFPSRSSPAPQTASQGSYRSEDAPPASPLSQDGFASFSTDSPYPAAVPGHLSERHADAFPASDPAVPASNVLAPFSGFSATWPAASANSPLAAAHQRHALSGPVTFDAFELGRSSEQELQAQSGQNSAFQAFHTAPGPAGDLAAQLDSIKAAQDPAWQSAQSDQLGSSQAIHKAAPDPAFPSVKSAQLGSTQAGQDSSFQAFQAVPAVEAIQQDGPVLTAPEADFQAFEAAPSLQTAPRRTASGPISLELFGMPEQEDEPLTFPVQASITAVSSAEAPTANGVPWADTQDGPAGSAAAADAAVVHEQQQEGLTASDRGVPRQTLSGPISFEEFGFEDVEDAPMQLPPSAFDPAAATAFSVSQQLPLAMRADAASHGLAFEPSFNGVLSESAALEPSFSALPSDPADGAQQADKALGYWDVLTVVMQACAAELQTGQQVWQQVLASSASEAFQTDPQGQTYLQALQQVFRLALLLQQAAEVHRDSRDEAGADAVAEAFRQTLAAVADDADVVGDVPVPSLNSVIDAQSVHQELQSIISRPDAWQPKQSHSAEPGKGPRPVWQKGCCAMSLLPLQTLQLPLTSLPSGRPCLATLKALWDNRIPLPLPSL